MYAWLAWKVKAFRSFASSNVGTCGIDQLLFGFEGLLEVGVLWWIRFQAYRLRGFFFWWRWDGARVLESTSWKEGVFPPLLLFTLLARSEEGVKHAAKGGGGGFTVAEHGFTGGGFVAEVWPGA